jgi:hypothetical protein
MSLMGRAHVFCLQALAKRYGFPMGEIAEGIQKSRARPRLLQLNRVGAANDLDNEDGAADKGDDDAVALATAEEEDEIASIECSTQH